MSSLTNDGATAAIELSQLSQRLQAQTMTTGPSTTRKEDLKGPAVPEWTEDEGSSLNPGGLVQAQTQNSAPSMIARDAQSTANAGAAPNTSVQSGTSTRRLGSLPVSTDERLLNFREVEARRHNLESQRRLPIQRRMKDQHKSTLEALRQWNQAQEKELPLLGSDSLTLWKVLSQRFWPSKIPTLPPNERLMSLVHFYYPPRAQIKVEVCDFGPGRAEHFTTTLPNIEDCWNQKPAWATVRWIQAPLGVGITQSSVEDLFLHSRAQRGRSFTNAGAPGFPYLRLDILNLRSRDNFQEMRDVYVLSKKVPELARNLDQNVVESIGNGNLQTDIKWRSKHLGVLPSFWNLSQPDMAWQLSEGFGVAWHGAMSALKPLDHKANEQILSRHPFYNSSQIVRDAFRLFHRADGVLLTFFPAVGVNYIDKDLVQHLKEPQAGYVDNADISVLSNIWKLFSQEGTDQWHNDTVEWFMVYLVTEMIATPHTLSQGYNAPSLPMAYHLIVQDLKKRRFDPWRRHESVKLVQDYIICVDELTVIVKDMKKNLQFLERLRKDCQQIDLETKGRVHNTKGKSAVERIDWAMSVVSENHELLANTLGDLSDSMLALFQLRSIEQNELAIMADLQNKAIVVFTGVTIIFLPLSFFASYFGMNLQGIVKTSKTENYFWSVCGSLAVVFIILTTIFAFRHKLARLGVKHVKRTSALAAYGDQLT